MSYNAEAVEGMETAAAELDLSGILAMLTPAQKKALFHAGLWALFDKTKDRSFKFKIGPVPVSVKIEKFRPLIVFWVGEPTAVVI